MKWEVCLIINLKSMKTPSQTDDKYHTVTSVFQIVIIKSHYPGLA